MAKSSAVFLKKNKGNFIIGKHSLGIVRILLIKLLFCITELLKKNDKVKTQFLGRVTILMSLYSLLISFNDSLEHKIFILNKNQLKII